MSEGLVRLPSLDLVRGFVAVGRRMSITLASNDLCLTQSAVSRQISTLEAQLGAKLLVRGFRSVTFTPDGERLFRSADGALQQLQDVFGEMRRAKSRQPVTLSASVGFAGLWLLPRLSRFQKLNPGIDLRISANNQIADLRNDGIDLAIRYAPASSAPVGATRLFGESIVPVAHPALRLKSLSAERLFAKVNLLEFDHPEYPWLQWQDWLVTMGLSETKPKGFIRFNQYDQVVQAALAGQGVALGRLELIQPLLDEGRLMVIDRPKSKTESMYAFWLIQADENPREDARRVAAWITEEVTAAQKTSTANESDYVRSRSLSLEPRKE